MAQRRDFIRFASACLGLMLVALAIGTSDDVLPAIRATPGEVGLAAGAATLVLIRFGDRRRA